VPDALTTAIQQDCLSLLAFNDEHGKLIVGLVAPELFEGDYRLIAERVVQFWQQNQSAPKAQTLNLFEDVFSNSERKRQTSVLKSIIKQMRETADHSNASYVVGQLSGFVGRQRRKAAMLRMMERMNQNTSLEEIDAIYSHIMRADNNVDFKPGLKLANIDKVLNFLQQRQNEFITGIPELDRAYVVPMRSAVSLWLAATGHGKCLGFGTPVLLYNGRVVSAEQVKVGDKLMGPDSKPRKVLSTCLGRGPLYKITPIKGAAWICNDEHILTLVHTRTGKVIDISIKDWLAANKNFRHLHKLFSPVVGVDFPGKSDPEVPPYFIGLWIGDGTKRLKEVAITKPDIEVQEACLQVAKDYDLQVKNWRREGFCPTWAITTKKVGKNPLLDAMRELFSHHYGIPQTILTASRYYRTQVLAGVIDSDGHLSHGCVEIAQKCRATAEGIAFLARSLGLKVVHKKKFINGQEYQRLNLLGNLSNIPTRIARKTAVPRRQKKDATRTGFKVSPIGIGYYAGFTLNSDGRFLLGDFTVTHNSWALAHIGYQALLARRKVLHVTLELVEEEVLQRFYQTMFRASKRKLEDYNVATIVKDNKKRKMIGKDIEKGQPQFHFSSPYIVEELRSRLVEMESFNNLIVKKFPMRGLTIDGLRGHLDRLEQFNKFIPDMVIIDYIGIMQTDSKNHRVTLGRVMEDFRGLCDERNIAGVTAQQVSKLGAQANVVAITHVAEDWSLTNTADQVIVYSATKEESNEGFARLYVAKARSEIDKFGVVITQDYRTGQFILDSVLLDHSYFEQFQPKPERQQKAANDEEEQEQEDDSKIFGR